MSDTPAPMLDVRNLVRSYPLRSGFFRAAKQRLLAVRGVSFTLQPGEILALVGESGCGKSTLGRALLRLEEPDSGAVHFQGRDLLTMPGRELFALRRSMQMIFQDPYSSLNPRMTVGDIIREPLAIHRIGTRAQQWDRVHQLLGEVGLKAEMADRYPHEFSGGQRQRVGIARALALEPSLIVADEPVSALDVSVQAQVLNLLVRLQRERGLAYIFISHDLNVVEYLADRVAIMYLGAIVEQGTAAEIFARPAHPYTRALIAASPVADPTARSDEPPIVGEIPSPVNPPSGCAFHPRCPFAVEACKQQTPPLEEWRGRQVACLRRDEIAG